MPPPTLEISAHCYNSWNSYVHSGKFQAVGGYGNYAIYVKRTIDANGKWWFFYFDGFGWKFSYSGQKALPGVSLWGTQVTPYDENRQGQFKTFRDKN